MASAPVTPVPAPKPPVVTDSNIITVLKHDWTWLTTHIIMLALVAGLVFGGVYGVESLIAKHEAASASAAHVQLVEAQQASAAILAQASAQNAQYLQLLQTVTSQNAQLAAQISKRDKQVQTQVKADATLDAKQTAERLATQTSAPAGAITVVGDDLTISLPVARDITSGLDLLVGAQAGRADVEKQLVAETTVATAAAATIAEKNAVITAKDAEIAAGTKACTTQVAALKADARKGKVKWFFIGYVAGWGSAIAVKIFAL